MRESMNPGSFPSSVLQNVKAVSFLCTPTVILKFITLPFLCVKHKGCQVLWSLFLYYSNVILQIHFQRFSHPRGRKGPVCLVCPKHWPSPVLSSFFFFGPTAISRGLLCYRLLLKAWGEQRGTELGLVFSFSWGLCPLPHCRGSFSLLCNFFPFLFFPEFQVPPILPFEFLEETNRIQFQFFLLKLIVSACGFLQDCLPQLSKFSPPSFCCGCVSLLCQI